MKLHHTLFALASLAMAGQAQSSPIVVSVENLTPGLGGSLLIEDNDPTFGDAGPVSLNWNPNNSSSTGLRKWHYPFWATVYPTGPQSLWETYSGKGGAYCASGATTSCLLDMQVQGGYTVSLDSFFLGSWIEPPQATVPPPFDPADYTRSIAYSVIDLADDSVVASGTPLVTLLGSVINVHATSTVGFRISFGPDGYDGAINDITYRFDRAEPVSVPEPGTLALGALALAAASCTRRRVAG
jgi:hypothetical protein